MGKSAGGLVPGVETGGTGVNNESGKPNLGGAGQHGHGDDQPGPLPEGCNQTEAGRASQAVGAAAEQAGGEGNEVAAGAGAGPVPQTM